MIYSIEKSVKYLFILNFFAIAFDGLVSFYILATQKEDYVAGSLLIGLAIKLIMVSKVLIILPFFSIVTDIFTPF